MRDAVGEYERGIIARTMAVTVGNISEAAKILDVPRQTQMCIRDRFKRYIRRYNCLCDAG